MNPKYELAYKFVRAEFHEDEFGNEYVSVLSPTGVLLIQLAIEDFSYLFLEVDAPQLFDEADYAT